MVFDKDGNRDPGMSYDDAKEMIKKEGYLYNDLPQQYKTAETHGLMNDYWENRFLELYLELKSNPDKLAEIKEGMRASGRKPTTGQQKQFDSPVHDPAPMGGSPAPVNDSTNKFDDFIEKAKAAGVLDELKKSIEKLSE